MKANISGDRSVRWLFSLCVGTILIIIGVSSLSAQLIWVASESQKVHPRFGGLITKEYSTSKDWSGDPVKSNSFIWSSSTRTATLAGARGEALGFQVIIEKGSQSELTGVHVYATNLKTADGATISKNSFEFLRQAYVKGGDTMYPDPLIPLKDCPDYDYFSIPDLDQKPVNNNNQAVWVDLFIPQHVEAGMYIGKVIVECDQMDDFEINVSLQVYNFSIPDIPNYDYEMNHYGLRMHYNWPGGEPPSEEVYVEFERNAYRLCHKDRLRFNLVPYNHDGSPSGWEHITLFPELSGSGDSIHVSDWSSYDKRYGPLLDGSAFVDMPRAGVPLSNWILPFNHRYSSDYNEVWKNGDPNDFPFWGKVPLYEKENIEVMKEFEEHLNEKGWTVPLYHVFYNEKGRDKFKDQIAFGDNELEWLLDEPVELVDYEAIRYYGEIFHNGFSNTLRPVEYVGDAVYQGSGFPNPDDARFVFRLDIGRQNRLEGYLDGYVDLWNVGGDAGEERYVLTEVQERIDKGDRAMYYGPWHYQYTNYNLDLIWSGWNDYRRKSTGHELWLTVGWIEGMGADWQKVTEDYYKGATTYMYPGYKVGLNGPVPTNRMKVIRRGVQDWEYLYLLEQATGSRQASEDIMYSVLGQGDINYSDDRRSAKLTEETFVDLRAQLAAAIEEAGGGASTMKRGDYSGDGRLALNDAISLLVLMSQNPDNMELDYNGDGRVSVTDAIKLIIDIMATL